MPVSVWVIEKHFTDAPYVLYDFRYTFASRCVQAGVGLVELAALLGHSNLVTTMRYVHVLKQQKIVAVGKLEKYIQLAKEVRLRTEEAEEPLSPVAEKR